MSPHITRLEKWIAPRALPLLAVISVLVLGGGVTAYFIVAHNFERVDRLERVIRCQHSATCRSFIYRAIREILEHEESPRSDTQKKHRQGVTFHLGPKDAHGSAPVLVEVPDQAEGHTPGQETAPNPQNPPETPESGGQAHGHPEGHESPQTPAQEGSDVPEDREQKSTPITPPERVGNAPTPLPPETAHVEPELPPPAAEVVERVEGIICSALREVHHLC